MTRRITPGLLHIARLRIAHLSLAAMPIPVQLRMAALAFVGLGYMVGSYLLMADPQPSAWNAVGVLAPMLLAIAVGAWRGGQRALGSLAALGLVALCVPAALGTPIPPQRLYLAQHVGVHLFLGFGFGSSLVAGRTPLITLLASHVHREVPPALQRYTRSVTLAWTIYFVAMAAVSVLLYAFASFETWALFANLLTPIAIALMFASEHLLRYRLHPEFERISIADAVRSYRMKSLPARAMPAPVEPIVR